MPRLTLLLAWGRHFRAGAVKECAVAPCAEEAQFVSHIANVIAYWTAARAQADDVLRIRDFHVLQMKFKTLKARLLVLVGAGALLIGLDGAAGVAQAQAASTSTKEQVTQQLSD